jgi:tetratricopeptide (TPR) repeat protein
MKPIDTPAALGRELKRWIRSSRDRPVKIPTLAKRLNISQSSLYAYLAGTTVPPAETLDDLLREIAVPVPERRRLATARDLLHGRDHGRRAASASPAAPAVPVPRQLPPDPAGFVGRTTERAELDATLRRARTRAGAPVVAAICGQAGVGKTALTVHWGHRVATEFPDGCLYADLHGYSPGEPRSSSEVLAGFLRGLGRTDAEIPSDPEERAAWYRSALAGRRLLVVLDNAYDTDQVRPLVPGDSGCFVVVTSRGLLTGLSVRPGAHLISLDPLPRDDELDLLRTHIGERVQREPDAARELAARCAGLPLALRIVSAQAVRQPGQSLTDLAAELSQESGLDQFDVGDADTAVRTVFSWSDRHLPETAAQDFRLLGAQPLPELDDYAAAALFGTSPVRARRRLDGLVSGHLVQQRGGRWYGMHDLVRSYATELAAEARTSFADDLTRLFDHHLAAAARAMGILHPRDQEPEPDVALPPMEDASQARHWLERRWRNLLTLAEFGARGGWPGHTIRLVATLRRHLDQGGLHHDGLELLDHALAACHATGDRVEEGATLYHLGVAYLRLGRLNEAMDHHQRALQICRDAGDRYGEAGSLNNLGNLLERLGRYQEATDHYEQALVLAPQLGFRNGEATLLNNLGFVAGRQGRHDAAERHCRHALEIYRGIGDGSGTARALVNLGGIAYQRGRHDEALDHYRRSLAQAREVSGRGIEVEALNGLGETYRAMDLLTESARHHDDALAAARQLDDPYAEAQSLEGLGHTASAAGDTDRANEYWHAALVIYHRLGLPDADRLSALAPEAGPTLRQHAHHHTKENSR